MGDFGYQSGDPPEGGPWLLSWEMQQQQQQQLLLLQLMLLLQQRVALQLF